MNRPKSLETNNKNFNDIDMINGNNHGNCNIPSPFLQHFASISSNFCGKNIKQKEKLGLNNNRSLLTTQRRLQKVGLVQALRSQQSNQCNAKSTYISRGRKALKLINGSKKKR